MTRTEANADTRFFPGYLWVSDYADCRTGLCIMADTIADAAKTFLMPQMMHWNKGRTLTAYVMANRDSVPVKVEIQW